MLSQENGGTTNLVHESIDAEVVAVEEPVTTENSIESTAESYQAEMELQLPDQNTSAVSAIHNSQTGSFSWRQRLRRAMPGYVDDKPSRHKQANGNKENEDDDDNNVLHGLDRLILGLAIPSMINLAVVPFVNSVDTFWVGRMGIALALAGQAAANQAFFTLYFLVAFLPTITAPLVAAAVGSGQEEEAQARVSESLFLCNVLGALGTILLVGFPETSLGLVLPAGAPAMEYAKPYLRFRGLGVIPALLSATGFAAYRGLLDTVTPLKVSLATNLLNLVLDPLLIFVSPLGFVGAAVATILSEAASGVTYLKLLLRRKLSTWRLLVTPPPWKSILPILQGGLSILGRQAALNIGILLAARRAQSMDPTGVAAAAYGIVMQFHSLGIVLHVAVQSTAATLVPAALAKSGETHARQVGDRIFAWGSIVGLVLGVVQMAALPLVVPLFSTLPQVQAAVQGPAALSALLHVLNGPVFAGEGVMLGLGSFRDLMLITAGGIASMIAALWALGQQRLNGILWSFVVFSTLQAVAVVTHYLKIGPLAIRNKDNKKKMPLLLG